MPNWTSNIIRAEGRPTHLRAFLKSVKSPDEIFDFNRIIPMPEILNHTGCGSRIINGKEVTSWYVIHKGDPLPADSEVRLFTRKEEALLKKIGHRDWYSWCLANWGTKWNACHTAITEKCRKDTFVEIRFDTAWCEPQPILRRMIEMFPKISFTCSWQHEDEQGLWHSLETQGEAA